MLKDVVSVTMSDHHLGHRKNTPTHMTTAIQKWMAEYDTKFYDVDILFLAGDLFDKALWFNQAGMSDVLRIMIQLAKYCVNHTVKLRVLEGTKSHDRGQSAHFLPLIEHIEGLDFKYVDILMIEHIKEWDYTVLYVPDEWRPDPNDTWMEVQEELVKHHLSKVDTSVMHGVFDYQVPSMAPGPKHNANNYLLITNYYIHIGHHHIYNPMDRIIPQGSFDRISFGEEDPKGAILSHYNQDGTMSYERLLNNHAMLFTKIQLTEDYDANTTIIADTVGPMPNHSRVRLCGTLDMPYMNNLKELKFRYPMLYFDREVIKETTDTTDSELSKIVPMHHTVTLDARQLPITLKDRLEKKGYDTTQINTLLRVFKNINTPT